MKNLILLFSLLILTLAAFSAEPPPPVPVGVWSFQQSYRVTNLRMAEVVPSPGSKPSDRVVELRQSGFQCVHQSPTKYLCTKNIKDAKLTAANSPITLCLRT